MMSNILVLAIVAVLFFSSLMYIRKKKKTGARCIGCPDSGTCPHCTKK